MFKTTPYSHQLESYNLSKDKKAFALLMEQGTGKTKVALDKTAYLYGQGLINGLLVFAPNGVHRNWVINEIPAHLPDYCNATSAWYASSMTKAEAIAFEKLFEPGHNLRVLTMNYEALTSDKGRKAAERFLRTFKVHVVADESHKIKNPGAQRTKHILKLRKLAAYATISTGTPVTQSPLDTFTQFMFLDEHILPTTSYYVFKARYAVLLDDSSPVLRHIKQRTSGRGNPQIVATDREGRPLYKNLDELQRLIQPYSFRCLKADCLDLPDKVYSRRYFELTPEQKSLYKQIKDDLRIEFGNGQFEAMSKLTAVLRLQQIASGILPLPDGELPIFETPDKNPRIKALLDIAEECAGKMIVWARFRMDIASIVKALEAAYPNSVVEYHGGVDHDSRAKAVKSFQDDPEVRFFVGTQQAGGTGLTLTAASTVVYYSNDFSLENRLQSEDRAHRIGQKNTVTYYDLEAVNTVDRRIVNALRMKKDVASAITNDPLTDWIE